MRATRNPTPPPTTITIDKAHARRFLLGHLGLLPPRQLQGAQGVLDFIRRVNCIQQDPINVVGQNPHLVLQARVRDFTPAMLGELLYRERRLVDGFDKQMAIYPVEDWPQFAYHREQRARGHMNSASTAAAARLVPFVRDEIAARGPLSSSDLEDQTRMDWWLTETVRAASIALDILLYAGTTVVHHRVGTRRYFDLAERVLPPALLRQPAPHATADEYLDWHVLRRVGGLGLVSLRVTAAFGGMVGWRGGRIRAAILRLAEAGHLVPVSIAELPRQRFFVRRDELPALERSGKRPRTKPRVAFIAPLDNLMWDLSMVRALFDFDYVWEVYKPAEKRIYGYYVLPVLFGDRFVARVDPAFDRASGVLSLNGWWWEEGVDRQDPAMLSAIGECVSTFASYLGARDVRLAGKVRRTLGAGFRIER